MKTVFEWDADKAAGNVRKHGISFETAVAAFSDPFVLTTVDRVENGEQRWQTVEVIRIISAREANRKERKRYEEDAR